MKLTITIIVLMRSIPPFIAWRWQCACYVSTRYNCNGLSCTLRLLKYEHRMLWSLLTSALRCSCSPTQWMVFVIQQESVEKVVFVYSVMWSMLRVSTSESMIPRPCFQILQTSLIYCSTASLLPAILPPSTARQQAIFWRRYYCSYTSIPLVFHYLFAELVHLYIWQVY